MYVVGTAALLIAVPPGKLDSITGVPQAMAEIGIVAGIPMIGFVTALVLVASNLGGVSAWVAANARLPFAMGLHAQLPEMLGRVHPRWRSPYVSLLMQAVITTLLTVATMAGATVRQAIDVLTDMTIVLYFIPLLYMYAALPVHTASRGPGRRGTVPHPRRFRGRERDRGQRLSGHAQCDRAVGDTAGRRLEPAAVRAQGRGRFGRSRRAGVRALLDRAPALTALRCAR